MKKKVIKTTLILLLISCFSKFLSFVIRITIARILDQQAMTYYSLTSPVLGFLMTLAHFGIPSALTQLVASKKKPQDSLTAAIVLSLINNFLLILLCLLGIPLYAHLILKQSILIPVLYACVPMLPLIMVSGLCKGYLIGRQNMTLASSSQITEEITRLIFLLVFYPLFSKSPVSLAVFAILSQSAGEIGSCIHLGFGLLFQGAHQFKRLPFQQVQLSSIKELLNLSLPMTSARLIGSLTAFLEPIVLINFAKEALKDTYLTLFSMMNTYVLSLVTLPAFFSMVISSWLLPAFSQAYVHHQDRARKLFLISTVFCFGIGISLCSVLALFAQPLCVLLYDKTDMVPLLKMLALPFALFSIQPVLTSILHGANQSKRALMNTLCGCIVRLVFIWWMSQSSVEYCAPIALILSVTTTTLLHFQACCSLFVHDKKTILHP